MGATHAIAKFDLQFQNRIPRELDKNFDTPGISCCFMKYYNRSYKKVMPIPGFQPIYAK